VQVSETLDKTRDQILQELSVYITPVSHITDFFPDTQA
jgi:hypothetical protein